MEYIYLIILLIILTMYCKYKVFQLNLNFNLKDQ